MPELEPQCFIRSGECIKECELYRALSKTQIDLGETNSRRAKLHAMKLALGPLIVLSGIEPEHVLAVVGACAKGNSRSNLIKNVIPEPPKLNP